MKFLPIIFCALMLAGTTMFAQQQQQQPNPNQMAPTQTITGCLTKSSTNGEYVLSEKGGQKYTFNGPSRLDSYVNHTVQMTGTMNNQSNGEKQFQPQSVKTVSDTCEGGQ